MSVSVMKNQQTDSQLHPMKCGMLNDFELYNVHAESAEMEKWSIPNTKINYVEYNRKDITIK